MKYRKDGYCAKKCSIVKRVFFMLMLTVFTCIPAMAATVPDANNVINGLSTHSEVDKITNPIVGMFGSAYDVVITIGVALMVISVIVVAIQLVISGNGGKREEAKGQLFWIAVAGIGLGAVLTIATMLMEFGASLDDAAGSTTPPQQELSMLYDVYES